jgi:integrase
MWYLQYRVDTPDVDDKGKPKRAKIAVQLGPSKGKGAIGRRQAERLAADQYISKLDQSAIRPGSMVTLQAFVDRRFEPDWIQSLKPTGQTFYRSILKKHVLPALGALQLREVTLGHVQQLIRACQVKKLSGQTCIHVRNCTSAIFRHALHLGLWSGPLPTEGVRMPEKRAKERRALTWEQACAVSRRIPEVVRTKHVSWQAGKRGAVLDREATEISALVLVLSATGLRIGEAMGLRWRRVNLTTLPVVMDGELLPSFSLAVRENYVMGRYQTLKTEGSRRIIPLPTWVCDLLRPMASRLEWAMPDDPVWAGSAGRPLDQHNAARRVLKPAAALEGLPWVSWHCFRHTNATLADAAGLTVAERQKVLGHAGAQMTMRYTHTEIERVRGLLETMKPPSVLQ